ncbi:MAG TPA: tetratricopeptide repeat protein [Pyrinomonadaceae bacterium]|jgi:tetratricopeptide (TPR) repeat protein|nr:tetratricopeptide repeat protein [Pyrinomonadaceae bacterium]
MTRQKNSIAAALAALLLSAAPVLAQSGATRPRRVAPTQPATPAPADTASTAAPPAGAAQTGTVAQAFALYEQKKYEEAVRAARAVTDADPKNSDGWKVAGFAEVALGKYAEGAADLQRALDLQRAAKAEDPNTVKALAQAYTRVEKYAEALPLLVSATSTGTPDATLLYFRGLAEANTGKAADAEKSFNAAIKADPKNTGSLFYLGRMAWDRKDYTGAINWLNRATLADATLAQAWTLLTYSYLNRGAAATGPKADADYLAAVRASESLLKLKPNDEAALNLNAQALVRAGQFVRAATVLEKAAAGDAAKPETLYLLGFSHNRAKNYPRAAAALERAAQKAPDNVDVYRELGFAYEASKQYAKALAAYEKGLQLAPDDAYFKESADRVRPFAK